MDLVDYLEKFIGTPYKWGGKHPLEGYDCSGLVQEGLRAIGFDPPGDQTVQLLFDHFAKKLFRSMGAPTRNCLLFFGKSRFELTHVAVAINEWQMIEAGGGGSRTNTQVDAIRDEAMVRVRPIARRKDLLFILEVL